MTWSAHLSNELSEEFASGVYVSADAVLDLQLAVLEGLTEEAGRELEVGGLVLGALSPEVRIDAVVPVPNTS